MFSLLRNIKRFIRSYDHFGVSLNFNIRNRKQYQSVWGGIMSIAMTIVLLYIFITGLISLLLRDKFQVVMLFIQIDVQQLQNMDPDQQEMNITNFMFAIKLDNPFSLYYPNENKTPFQIVMNQVQISTLADGSRNKTTLHQIFFEQCRDTHFKNLNQEGFQELKADLGSYLCLPLNFSLKLKGTFNSKFFLYPALKVSICYTKDCYTKEQIEYLAQNKSILVSLSTLIQSSIYMRNSKDNYLFRYLNSDFYLQTNLLEESKSDIFFKNNKIIAENSLLSLYKEEERKDFWSFQLYNYREFKGYHASPSTLFSLNFRISQDYEQHKKTAETIDSFLSYFGGILKIISTIFGLVALSYNEMGLKISLANHLYQFNIPKRKNGKFEFSYDKLLSVIQNQLNRVSDLQSKLKQHTKTLVRTSMVMRVWNSQKFQHNSISNQQSLQRDQIETPQIDQLQFSKYVEQLQDYKGNFLQRLITAFNSTRHDLRLGINFILYQLLWCSCCEEVEITKKMLRECKTVIDKDLDIIHLLQKIQEIDKLKSIILEKDQIKVFSYTPKPIINIDPTYQHQPPEEAKGIELFQQLNQQRQNKKIKKYNYSLNKPKRLMKIYDSYSRLKQQHNNKKNQRIIQLLGPTIEMIFLKYYEIQNMAKGMNIETTENFENGNPQVEFQVEAPLPENSQNNTHRVIQPKLDSQIIKFHQITPKNLLEKDELLHSD
ncbi:unnamed protein product (macronuclear) [Paramecium tetraurelia]|uniref:Transmembrane protein n=1 Tax=Paramecium tetraurelia TaxID=5888 RepID=A0CRN2_PARTE|nr:uncharacterized protein GSPATT00009764001 [Paramecium tetraurelia]CAK73449.1 unnamed protein product [Paramecium tetraurelia]|eukprot:XP_001440846.1 hypothetical protein (macronuclear) [Paramecium tetraurelia strain d4-2]